MKHTKKLHGPDDLFADRTLCGRECSCSVTESETITFGTVPYWEMTCSNCLRTAKARDIDCAEPLPAEALGIQAWRLKREGLRAPVIVPELEANGFLLRLKREFTRWLHAF